jgi:hypothetical protein
LALTRYPWIGWSTSALQVVPPAPRTRQDNFFSLFTGLLSVVNRQPSSGREREFNDSLYAAMMSVEMEPEGVFLHLLGNSDASSLWHLADAEQALNPVPCRCRLWESAHGVGADAEELPL